MITAQFEMNMEDDHSRLRVEFKSALKQFAAKSVDLKLTEELATSCEAKLEEKLKSVAADDAKLDEIHYKVWKAEEKFCDEFWDFSRCNDFSDHFRLRYPAAAERYTGSECGGSKNCIGEDQVGDSTREIEATERLIRCIEGDRAAVEKELKKAEAELNQPRYFSRDPEIQKLTDSLRETQREILAIEARTREIVEENTVDYLFDFRKNSSTVEKPKEESEENEETAMNLRADGKVLGPRTREKTDVRRSQLSMKPVVYLRKLEDDPSVDPLHRKREDRVVSFRVEEQCVTESKEQLTFDFVSAKVLFENRDLNYDKDKPIASTSAIGNTTKESPPSRFTRSSSPEDIILSPDIQARCDHGKPVKFTVKKMSTISMKLAARRQAGNN